MTDSLSDRLSRWAQQLQEWLERRGIYVTIGAGTLVLMGILGLSLASGVVVAVWFQAGGSVVQKTVHVSLSPAPETLVPQEISSPVDASSRTVATFLFEGLLRYNAEGNLVPGVAEEIPTSEDGGLQYRFKLREDALWSDGTPVTAQDFVRAAKNLLLGQSPFATLFSNLEGARSFIDQADPLAALPGVQAASPQILILRLASPREGFLHLLTLPAFYPAAPPPASAEEAVKRKGKALFNGPYVLEELTSEQLSLVSNHRYYRKATRPDRLVFQFGDDAQERFDGYRNGSLDITEVSISPGTLSSSLAEQYTQGPLDSTIGLIFDVGQPPFDDLLLRQAIARALERRTLAQREMETHASVAASWIPPSAAGHHPEADQPYPLSPDVAKRLLTQATRNSPLPEGRIPFQIEDTPLGHLMGRFVSAQLQSHLGLEIDLEVVSPKDYRQYMIDGTLSFTYLEWRTLYMDPASWLYDLFHTEGAFNFTGYSNPELDSLLDEAAGESDLLERRRLWNEAQELLLQDVAVITLVYPQRMAFIQPALGTVTMGPMDGKVPGSLSLRDGTSR